MRVLENRYLHREIELNNTVERYRQTVQYLVARVKPHHLIDESEARRVLTSVAESLFIRHRQGLLKQRPADTATLEEKLRHSLSVKQLREEFRTAQETIRRKFRRW